MHKSPLYTDHPSHTSHSSWNRFTHVKGGNTHFLNVESRQQSYGPHPRTKQNVKVSTLYTTHSSNFSKQIVSYQVRVRLHLVRLQYHIKFKFDCVSYQVQVRLCFKSGFGVVSVCGHLSRCTDTKYSTVESQTTVI